MGLPSGLANRDVPLPRLTQAVARRPHQLQIMSVGIHDRQAKASNATDACDLVGIHAIGKEVACPVKSG